MRVLAICSQQLTQILKVLCKVIAASLGTEVAHIGLHGYQAIEHIGHAVVLSIVACLVEIVDDLVLEDVVEHAQTTIIIPLQLVLILVGLWCLRGFIRMLLLLVLIQLLRVVIQQVRIARVHLQLIESPQLIKLEIFVVRFFHSVFVF